MKILRVLVCLLLVLAAAADAPKQRAIGTDPAFASYLKAYTGGVVQEGATLRVELAYPVPMDKQKTDLFRFKPALPGMSRWLSPTVVEFVPEGKLKDGITYEGIFRLGEVVEVGEKSCKEFPFQFRAVPKTAELTLDGITIRDEARLQGSIALSAPAQIGDISLTTDPEIPVTLTGEGKSWRFETAGIAREEKDTPVCITLKIKGFDEVAPLRTTIPASGVFKVIDTRIIRSGNPCVEVRFSEPLAAEAAKKGLIELSGVTRQTLDIRDNCARIYYEGRSDNVSLSVYSGVRSAFGLSLEEDFQTTFPPADPLPAVELPFSGNILPDEANLVLPFRAVNLSAVDLQVIKIYEDNILLFLQENDLDESSELRRAGRLVLSHQIPLYQEGNVDLHKWNDFNVDLSGLFKQEPGAIYRIKLSFRREYSLYGGKPAPQMIPVSSGKPSDEEEAEWDEQSSYWWDSDYDWRLYNWEDRDNPNTPSYYMVSDRFPRVNLLSSNMGIVAKYADGKKMWAAVTDIKDAAPLSGVDLEVYDYQLQRVGTGKTDAEGLAEIPVSRKPFAVVARRGKTTGYLHMKDGYEKSLSRFDVSGQAVAKGLKAFVYGERGVWRPGDTLHVSMILADKARQLPESHPAALELYTPQGQFYTRMTSTGQDGFYTFPIVTEADDPTGIWNAYIKVGGSSFHKSLRIETIKPNRLKIDLDLGGSLLVGGSRLDTRIASSWLTGVPASGLKAHSVMTLSKASGTFKGFNGYIFRNPLSSFTTSEHELFNVTLSSGGTAEPTINLPDAEDAPGLLSAFIVTSVMENGGDESFTTQTLTFSPFPAYVGVKFPSEGELETGKDHEIRVAAVNALGNRLPGRTLDYYVFKLQWSWWWENDPEELLNYVNGSESRPVDYGSVVSGAEDATFTLRAEDEQWGRYLVVVRDRDGGHISGKTVVIDTPGYWGRSNRKDPDALTMLSFSTDKESYLAGETATVFIPAAAGGRALVSLENAGGVISRKWVATNAAQDAAYTFTVTPEMAPNFYVNVTLVQPYAVTANDLPLRLYGVKRVKVENPESHLAPVIVAPQTVEPEKSFKVQVSEKNGKPMTYTLAIVDEGLLDLTAFKTPSPWETMYRTEALGVKTWDLYDRVVGFRGGPIGSMFSIGGDQEVIHSAKKDNRFNPVVKFLGPFTLEKGTATHEITLPMYVGSVRAMVVAGHEGAYGNADKSITVKAPLMLLSSLPAQASTGDKIVLPVNVFVLEDDIKSVKVTVKAEGALQVEGPKVAEVPFSKAGDRVVRFSLKAVGEGPARVKIEATGASHKARETVNLEVTNPNPETVTVVDQALEAGESLTFDAGEGATLELAGFPAVDAAGLFRKMKNYPYNCTEQLSGRGLALLHLLPQLSDEDAEAASDLIEDFIHQIYSRQRSDGGFTLWPGGTWSYKWVTSMAGHFLSEASDAGFDVQEDVLDAWKRCQTNISQAYRRYGSEPYAELDQCYRLFTLAIADDPALGAMNRLKEAGNLHDRSAWMLAAAYAAAGRTQSAEELIARIDYDEDEYGSSDFTYGSSLRDWAVILMTLALTDNLSDAIPVAQVVASTINEGWYSTQEAAFASMAMDCLFSRLGSMGVNASVNGKSVVSAQSVYSQPVSGTVEVRNTSDEVLYASLTTVSRAPAGTPVPEAANGLTLTVRYVDSGGESVDPSELKQGTEFSAVVKVLNPSYRRVASIALSEIIPSGWEILNDRLRGGEEEDENVYRDIRDDRCNWFFDLRSGESRTVVLKLRAAYEGTYTLSSVTCSAMYDPHVFANTASGSAKVVR